MDNDENNKYSFISNNELNITRANEDSDLAAPHYVALEDADKFLCFATAITDEEMQELE